MNIYKNNTLLLFKHFLLSPSRPKTTSTAEYCLDSVKRYDYENFICTLLLKNTARSSAFAIRGFNVEVAKIGQQVTEPTTGLMRLKFWEDTINNCFCNDTSKIPQHPVAAELYKAITNTKLTKRYFKSLITSRQEHLRINAFNDLPQLEKYSEKSVSNVYYLILEGCGVRNVNADHAASHLGQAQGLVQQIRSIAMAKRLNIMPIPQDILTKNKVSHEEVSRGLPSEKLNECIFEVASRAHQHLKKARSLIKEVPAEAREVLLPAVPIANYLDKLQRFNYNALHPNLQQRSFKWLINLKWTHFRNKY